MPKVKSRRCAHASAAHNLALSAPRRWKVPLPPRALPPHPTPIQNLRVTWSRKRCAALSMVSRAACCLCRARAAAPRAIRRLDQRRAKAAATKQQARATPEGPENAAHSSSCTMISHRGPRPGATEEESARADAAAKPGLDQPGIQRGRGAEGRGGAGRAPLPGSRPEAGSAQWSRSSAAAWLGQLPNSQALGQKAQEEQEGRHPLPGDALRISSVVRRPGPARPPPRAPESPNSWRMRPGWSPLRERPIRTTGSSARLGSQT